MNFDEIEMCGHYVTIRVTKRLALVGLFLLTAYGLYQVGQKRGEERATENIINYLQQRQQQAVPDAQ